MRQKLIPKLLQEKDLKNYEKKRKPLNCLIKEDLDHFSFNCQNKPDILIVSDNRCIFIECKPSNPKKILNFCKNSLKLEKQLKKSLYSNDILFKFTRSFNKPNLDKCKFFLKNDKELEVILTDKPLEYEVSPIFREIELDYDELQKQLKYNHNPYRKDVLKRARSQRNNK